MRPTSLSWLSSRRAATRIAVLRRPYILRNPHRQCSCSAPYEQQQGPQITHEPPTASNPSSRDTFGNSSSSHKTTGEPVAADHRALGTELSLFTGHVSSPGSPLFLPDGTHVFQKLQDFLRAQYYFFGFQEVITPNLYKESLWQQSGHWDNYKHAMFSVTGGTASEESEDSRYSLKPMNCPGHCLLYKSQNRGWRELPVRYADFSPLHRNEVSGSLSGLTRVRRFHQDDGHIFCTPEQVREEIISTLTFVDMVYTTLGVGPYKLVLSTRPEREYIGTNDAWALAETQLKDALSSSGQEWKVNPGDGAFYGPKIDIILTDRKGKEHQTATIQLDFQLPLRFNLEYRSRAGSMGVPVLIHRAILGSLERFMALLIEQYQGHWPFWLSPRQMVILTVGEKEEVLDYAKITARNLAAPTGDWNTRDNSKPYPVGEPRYVVDTDFRGETLAKKIRDAKIKKYNIICFIGERNLREATLDLDFSGQPNQPETLKLLNTIKPESTSPIQDVISKKVRSRLPNVKLSGMQTLQAMKMLRQSYL